MPSATTDAQRAIAREVLRGIATHVVRDGERVRWGRPGNKERAVHLAAQLGHQFDPKCQSCDSDLLAVVKHAAR